MTYVRDDEESVRNLYATLDTAVLLALVPVLADRIGETKTALENYSRMKETAREHQVAVRENVNEALAALWNQGPSPEEFASLAQEFREALDQVEPSEDGLTLELATHAFDLHRRKRTALEVLEQRGILPSWLTMEP
ncbi:hypothetical protein [Cellulosimicrobium cellulans]|uniref:Uncharacterized protein n=1 Tax=Cellulosimicrobium cellulans TaxID=1710 RepID=A0A4Y4DWT7_CELCE|nr:hypothetical protein [Cellulosimicrobium cellulans]GED09173.1 hypothetical protein CCE02nite_11720 [Cellulosimicrobium cellulans]